MALNPYTKLIWKDTDAPVNPATSSDPYLNSSTLNTKEQQFQDAVNAIIGLQTNMGPKGGVVTLTYAATITPDASLTSQFRLTATGAVTFNPLVNGFDGETVTIYVFGSGAQNVTFTSSFEVTQQVPGRVFAIPNATWGAFRIYNRAGTWVLVDAYPQTIANNFPQLSAWLPSDHGLLAWSCDPIDTNGSYLVGANGTLVGAGLRLDAPATVSNISYQITGAGATFTAARNFIGIYAMGGALLGQSVDQSAVWNSTGFKTTALTSPVSLAAGLYQVAYITTATTRPTFCAAVVGGPIIFGRSANTQRNFIAANAYTALPATMPSNTSFANSVWFGLS